MIEKIKIKAMLNNEAEVNCMFKQLTDAAQLFTRQNINTIMINTINERARFFNVCEAIFTKIDSITISIFIFVMKRSDYEFFFKRTFQCIARRSSININNESLKMILYFLNEEKRINFLKMSAEHVSN